ncbi:MAG: cytosine methyltransferase [Oscillospiraceae bacterium]|jgi:N6-adenosine-specific RNA methylase IME4|nr:cytosine methyltransferase [Oscillospiraceae bacterium]
MQNRKQHYKTIMADPPTDILQHGSKGAIQHYDLMSMERLKAMPVADLAAKDAHLWLWTTAAALRESYDLMEAWGFTFRSILIWVKPRMGLGAYLRNTSEFILLGTKGKAPILFKGQPNWFLAPVQDHSHKPEEQYAIIERCSPGPYLELFARRNRPGWDAWGNEIESDIEIEGFSVPRVKGRKVL